MPVQVDQLADMISTVFMVHSGTNLETFSHLNKSLVITAAEIALHNFFNQVTCAAPPLCCLTSCCVSQHISVFCHHLMLHHVPAAQPVRISKIVDCEAHDGVLRQLLSVLGTSVPFSISCM